MSKQINSRLLYLIGDSKYTFNSNFKHWYWFIADLYDFESEIGIFCSYTYG